MNIKGACTSAIGQVGGWMKFRKEGQAFSVMASFQPNFGSGQEVSSTAGFGVLRKYKAYICVGEGAGFLEQGDEIGFGGWSFQLQTIEPVRLGGEVLYYQGTAILTEEGDRIG